MRIVTALAILISSCVLPARAISLVSSTTPDSVRSILQGRSGFAVIRDMDKRTLLVLRLPELTLDTLPSETGEIKYLRISPDGKYVVYNVGGRMFLRGLGELKATRREVGWGGRGTFWVHPAVAETSIVYSTMYEESVLIDTSGADTTKRTAYTGKTMRMPLGSGMQPSGVALELFDQSFKAGLSKDGRWLGTADKSPQIYDRRDHRLYQMTISKNSTCWPVMNPTADTARMDQVAYLNTWHDTIVTKNSRDSVVWAMPFPTELWGSCVPQSDQKWHSFAWSNHEDFVFTGVRLSRTAALDSGAQQLFLTIIRRTDKKCLLVCTGGYHQDLWLDSAAQYDGPVVGIANSRAIRSGLSHAKNRMQFAIALRTPTPSDCLFDLRGAALRKPRATGSFAAIPVVKRTEPIR